MAQDELQVVRARLGSYFDRDTSIKDQCVVNAMCLSLADVRMQTGISKVVVVASGDSFSITNDAPPLPIDRPGQLVDTAETLMTKLHTCHKHPGHDGFDNLICASGVAAVNAISNSARVITGSGSTAMVQKYSVGRPLNDFNEVKAKVNGTRLDFELDKRWTDGDFDLSAIEAKVRSLGVLLDGVNLSFKAS